MALENNGDIDVAFANEAMCNFRGLRNTLQMFAFNILTREVITLGYTWNLNLPY